jgi:methanogenic corrinoid protein MtbC1
MGILGLLGGVVIPLLNEIETGWTDGSIRISHEHLASAVLRTYLDRIRASMPGTPSSPRLIVTTPRNQHHEIGALMVAILAATQSWNVTYLGPNLPADEIVHVAKQLSANAIGLSLVFPVDDATLAEELMHLRAKLGGAIPIIVGGRATQNYAQPLLEIGAKVSQDLWSLRDILHEAASSRAA